MVLFELTPDLAVILVYTIPVLSISVTILLYFLHRYVKSAKIKRILDMFIVAPTLGQESNTNSQDSDTAAPKGGIISRIITTLPVVYLAIMLFLVGSLIGTFYTVMGDVGPAINPGATGNSRTIINIIFMDVFNAGWSGSLPWYDGFPFPLSDDIIYHETWEWLCFTAALGDNSVFFNGMVEIIIRFSLFFGALFLFPLLIPQVRKSFVPSLYLFTTGIMTMSGALFSCLAEIIKFTVFDGTLRFGYYELDASSGIPTAFAQIPMTLFPIALAMFVLFPIFGFLLWRSHYPETRKSAYLFSLYVVIILGASFLFHMW